MNPLTNVRNITQLNENDIKNGIFDHNRTWHSQYKDSAYIFVGGLPYDLTEGDVLCVFSQYGEIVNINLVRDKKTGKSQGYGFICYEDQRSTILAVDNLNGIKLGTRTIRVDHVSEYRTPKSDEKDEDGNYKVKVETGCAPKTPSPEPIEKKKIKKAKKEKKKKKKKKKERSDNESEESSSDEDSRRTLNNNKKLKVDSKKYESQWDKETKSSSKDEVVKQRRHRSRSRSRERKPSPSRNRERRRSRSRSRERKRSRSRSRDRHRR